MNDDFDELESRVPVMLPRLLQPNATQADIVKAVNGLAVEMQLVREAVRELGTNIGTFCQRIERAMGKMS